MKYGVYLQGIEQVIDDRNDKGQVIGQSKLVKHVIAQVNEPNDKGFADDPQIRITYLQPEVAPILPTGTLVSFELDTKTKKRNDGTTWEKIVPAEIKKVDKIFPDKKESTKK